MSILRISALLAAPLLLAACAGNGLQTAEQSTPQGSEFERRLHANYVEMARSEHEQGDYRDSDKFAGRAMAAGSGAAPEPETLNKRDLPRGHRAELADARARLLAALANGARETSPAEAARAQAMFDCWVEQQEENFQPEHIAACRGAFETAMSGLESGPRMAAAEPEAVAVNPEAAVYGVRFDFDSDALREDSEPVLRQILALLEAKPEVSLHIEGHTDALGTDHYNQDLSWRRAHSIVDWLVSNGVAAARLMAEGLGEADPVADNGTDDGRAANRRAKLEVLKN